MDSDDRWARVANVIEPWQHAVLAHRLYDTLGDRAALRMFMEHHVWAVWDFMSLLSRLQRDLTCVDVPWVPRSVDAAAQRFVNEIKLGEESDTHPDGGWTSHFALYLAAMEEVGADTGPVRLAVDRVASTVPRDARGPRQGSLSTTLSGLVALCGAPLAAARFVESTFDLAVEGTTLEVATAFALGREQLIPEMFEHLVDGSEGRLLLEYLRRHVELDEGEHGPLARQLVENLAGDDPARWRVVERTASVALRARLQLWDAVVAATEAARVPL